MNETRYFYVRLGNRRRRRRVFVFFEMFPNDAAVFPGEFDALVEEGTEATHEVETIMTHNKYKPDTYHNDIALIKLATPIQYSRFIVPACLPEQDFAESVNRPTL